MTWFLRNEVATAGYPVKLSVSLCEVTLRISFQEENEIKMENGKTTPPPLQLEEFNVKRWLDLQSTEYFDLGEAFILILPASFFLPALIQYRIRTKADEVPVRGVPWFLSNPGRSCSCRCMLVTARVSRCGGWNVRDCFWITRKKAAISQVSGDSQALCVVSMWFIYAEVFYWYVLSNL